MLSREIGLLRQVQVHQRGTSPFPTRTGTESASRHLRLLAGLFCDHELPKAAVIRLPDLGKYIYYDDMPWRVYGYTVSVTDSMLSLAYLLEDTALAGHLVQVPYWTEAVELQYALTLFHCRAQHPAGSTEAVMGILDVARQLYALDAPSKALAAAKVARAICQHHDAFTLHFTQTGIYALSGLDYLGAVPRLMAVEEIARVHCA